MWWIIVGFILVIVFMVCVPELKDERRLEKIQRERDLKVTEVFNRIRGIVENNNEIRDRLFQKSAETMRQAFNEYSEHKDKYLGLSIIKPNPSRSTDWLKYMDLHMHTEFLDIAYEPCVDIDSYYEKECRHLRDYKMNPVEDVVKQCALLYAVLDYNENLFYKTHDGDKYKTVEKKYMMLITFKFACIVPRAYGR